VSGAIAHGREHRGPLRIDTDVVIVGSGAGGAVVAAECAAAGLSVVVLEEGPHVAAVDYGRMRPSEHMRRLWRDGGMSFAVGVGDTPMINVAMGRGVGGSSVLTGGVCFRVPGEIAHTWVHERGLTDLSEEKLEPLYEEVEEIVHVEEVPASMRSEGVRRFEQGAEKMGYALKPLRRNTKGCNGCGMCNFGYPHQAKLSVDLTFLPRAVRDGARIVSDCRVDRVVVKGGRAVGVRGRLLNRGEGRRGRPGDEVHVTARRVVVSAGAWHTPLLLKRSGLGRRGGPLGRHLTLHPSFRMMARFDEPIRGWQGALQSAYSDAFQSEGITLVSLFVPPGVIAATMPGFGEQYVGRAKHIPHIAVFGGLIHDQGGGTVRRVPGREPLVTYRMAKQDRARIPRVIRLMAETFFAAGAAECFLPVLGLHAQTADDLAKLDLEHLPGRRFECASQHPLGSCRMGVDDRSGAVDDTGRFWGIDHLYVADGSVVPTSLGVNPQLTVMTMALRIARRMLEGVRH